MQEVILKEESGKEVKHDLFKLIIGWLRASLWLHSSSHLSGNLTIKKSSNVK